MMPAAGKVKAQDLQTRTPRSLPFAPVGPRQATYPRRLACSLSTRSVCNTTQVSATRNRKLA